jgi:hypothetical protein
MATSNRRVIKTIHGVFNYDMIRTIIDGIRPGMMLVSSTGELTLDALITYRFDFLVYDDQTSTLIHYDELT